MSFIERRLGDEIEIQGNVAPAEDWLDIFEQTSGD